MEDPTKDSTTKQTIYDQRSPPMTVSTAETTPTSTRVPNLPPEAFVGFRRYAELLEIMSWRTLKTKYRGSIIGIFWSLSNPILMTATYAAIFGTAFASYYQGSVWRYVVATFVGLTILNIFSQTSSQALASIVSSGGILNKLKLPPSIFPVSFVASNFFQFGIGALPVIALITLYITHNPINVIALLLPTLALALATTGFSLLTSALYVYFRDLPYLYEIFLFIVWITSPIFYPTALVPAKVQPFLALNPIIFIVGSFRQIAISHQWPDLSLAATAIVSGLACFLVGSFVYLKLQNDFLDLL